MARDALAVLAEQAPNKRAMVDDRPGGGVQEFDFQTLNRDVNRLAHSLLDRGVQRGEKVVWCGMNSPGWSFLYP